MKILKIFILVTFLLVLGAGILFYSKLIVPKITQESISESSSPEVLGIPSQNPGIDLEWKGSDIRAHYFQVKEVSKIRLLANFAEKKTSREIFEEEDCLALVNGGFYTPESTPTGLFISEAVQIKSFVVSQLSNAVFSVNDFETPRITRMPPEDPLRLAVQAGPLLVENGNIQDLKLVRDEQARRVVVGVTGSNETVFVVFYNQASTFTGPRLDDLPELLVAFQQKAGLSLADVMNLDGGAASSFITQDVSLLEVSPIGSYFCIK